MVNSFRILFYGRKSKTNADQQMPVYMRVTFEGARYEFSTGYYVTEQEWVDSNLRKPRMPKSIELNSLTDALRIKAIDVQKKLMLTGQPFNLRDFQNEWEQKKEVQKT